MVLFRPTKYPSTFLLTHSINFWELDIKTPAKNLNLPTKKLIVIYSGTICNFASCFSKSPVNVLSDLQNLKKKTKKKEENKNQKKKRMNTQDANKCANLILKRIWVEGDKWGNKKTI